MFLFWMSFSVIMIHTFFASVPVSGIRTAHFPWTSDWVLWNFTGSIWLPNMLIAAHIGHSKTLAQTSWPKPSPSLPMEQTRYLGSFFLWGREGNSLNYSMFFLSCPWASCMRQSTKYLGTQTCELLIGAVSFNEDPCCMGFRPCSSCGNFGRAHFSRKQYGEGIALPCFGGCDGWMWEGWSPTTTHLCGSGWQYSKRVEKLDKSHLCSTAGAKPLSEVTWFANARFLHFTRVYFFLMGWLFWFS